MSWNAIELLMNRTSAPAGTRATVGANVQPSILTVDASASDGAPGLALAAVTAAAGQRGAGHGPAEHQDEWETGEQESDSAAHRVVLRASDVRP